MPTDISSKQLAVVWQTSKHMAARQVYWDAMRCRSASSIIGIVGQPIKKSDSESAITKWFISDLLPVVVGRLLTNTYINRPLPITIMSAIAGRMKCFNVMSSCKRLDVSLEMFVYSMVLIID